MSTPRLGFIGFGEAAASIALGLHEEGLKIYWHMTNYRLIPIGDH